MFDAEALGAELAELVKGHLAEATAPLIARIETLEAEAEATRAERDTEVQRSAAISTEVERLFGRLHGRISELEGRSSDLNDKSHVDEQTAALRSEVAELRALVDAIPEPPVIELPDVKALVDEAVAAIPAAKDGVDGKDADPEVIRTMVAEAVAQIPAPQDGKSVTLADLAPMVAEAVQRAAEALPAPKDGVGVAGAIIDRSGSLVLTLTDGTVRELGQVVGGDGRDGMDGKAGERGEPGFGLDDFDVDIKDERTIVLKFSRGDVLETYELAFPVVIYRGVYKDEQAYERGDMVSRGGNLYHCNAPTTDKPESGSEAWTLSARRGRDGKDGLPGTKGDPGPKGEPGRDARNWS